MLKGKPVLYYTLKAFHSSKYQPKLIVVMDPEHRSIWDELCKEHAIKIPHAIADGGKERFDSVKNGLASINTNGFAAVHDAVRPLVSTKLIDTLFEG
ncbi:MAG: 2-C-methyl-D-erythritol 4-phosphate cytidylyltransferase, partial [Chitinophagaceae bacterium]